MHSAWLAWAGGAWSHMQGLVAVLMTLTKRDVADAVVSLLSCGHTPLPMGKGSTPPVSACAVHPSGVDGARDDDSESTPTFTTDEVVPFENPDGEDGGKLERTPTEVWNLNVINIS